MDLLTCDTPIPVGGLTVQVYAIVPGDPPSFAVAPVADEHERGIYLHVRPSEGDTICVEVHDVWGWDDATMILGSWTSLPAASWTNWPAPIVEPMLATTTAPDFDDPATYDAASERPTWREKVAWFALVWAVLSGRD